MSVHACVWRGRGGIEAVQLPHDGRPSVLTLRSKKDGLSIRCYVEIVEVAVRRTNEKAAEIKPSL